MFVYRCVHLLTNKMPQSGAYVSGAYVNHGSNALSRGYSPVKKGCAGRENSPHKNKTLLVLRLLAIGPCRSHVDHSEVAEWGLRQP